jgi:hypothetical protein
VLVVFFCVGGSDTGSACHLLATEGCELLSDGLLGLSLTGSDRSEAGSNEHRWCQHGGSGGGFSGASATSPGRYLVLRIRR